MATCPFTGIKIDGCYDCTRFEGTMVTPICGIYDFYIEELKLKFPQLNTIDMEKILSEYNKK